MKGIARVYDHVTPAMNEHLVDALEARWKASVVALTAAERAQLMLWFPKLRGTLETGIGEAVQNGFAEFSPNDLRLQAGRELA